jgi:outer membrane protein TolC
MKTPLRLPRLLLSAMLSALPAFAADAPPVLDLDRCVRTALAQNLSLAIAQKDVDIADARRRAAVLALGTALTLKATRTTGKAQDQDVESDFTERSYGVQATQPLFNGGRLWSAERQAVLGADIARLQLDKQRLDVLQSVAEAYWRTVAAEKSLSVLNEAHARLQEDLEKAVRHELGNVRSAKIELLSTRAQNRECEAAITEEEDARSRSRIALLDALGERRASDFTVPGEVPSRKVDVPDAEVVRLARDHRPEYKISQKLVESSLMARRISKSGLYPRVDLNGFYGRSGSAFTATEPFHFQKDWNAGLTVAWPIFGNTLKYTAFREHTSPQLGESSRTETDNETVSLSLGDALSSGIESLQGRRNYMEEEWRFEKSRRDLEEEALSALRRVRSAWNRAAAAEARAEEAEQQFKETVALVQDDRAHLGDLAAARLRVALARGAQVKARAEHRIAVAALNRAVGVSDYFEKLGASQ